MFLLRNGKLCFYLFNTRSTEQAVFLCHSPRLPTLLSTLFPDAPESKKLAPELKGAPLRVKNLSLRIKNSPLRVKNSPLN
jgi:hypothetical protein